MATEDIRKLGTRKEEEGHGTRGNVVSIGRGPEGVDGETETDSEVQAENVVRDPFLPGTDIQWAWDSTSIGYFKRCPRLYYYLMIKGYRASEESVHIRYGYEVHKAAEDYEKLKAQKIKHDEAVFHVTKALLYRVSDWSPEHKYKNRDSLVRTSVWYLEKYKDDPAKTYIRPNGEPAVELSFNFPLDWGPPGSDLPYHLCGHLDRVVSFNGDLFANDIKTTTTTPGPYYWNQFNPDNQMSLYTLASSIVLDAPIKGVMITSAQVMIDGTRFTRGTTYRTKDQLDEWVEDLKWWLDQAYNCAATGYYPMNDTACDKYGGCMFRDICSKSPGVRDAFLRSDFVVGEVWNPLKIR